MSYVNLRAPNERVRSDARVVYRMAYHRQREKRVDCLVPM